MRTALVLLSILTLPISARAQGADNCAQAQVISGTGSFAFDNTNATLDGVSNPLCTAFGSSNIDLDVWFSWTAPSDGIFTIDTCGATFDTKVAVYDGSCAGLVLVCNDDSCQTQSRLSFVATSGQTYLIRVGVFPGASGGAGMFTITDPTPTLNPANGHLYLPVFGHVAWDTARTTAAAQVFQGTPGHLVTITDAAEDQFVYSTLVPGGLGNAWLGAEQNMNSPTFSEPGGGWEWVTGEPFTYTDWTAGEPNNGAGAEHVLGYWPADQWNDYQPGDTGVIAYVIEWDSVSIGTNFCLSIPNSSGMSSVITATGSASVLDQDVTLTAEGCPANVPGIFFLGTTQTLVAFGDGFRCIALPINRVRPFAFADGAGIAARTLDWTLPYAVTIQPGVTVNFQYWFRDAPAMNTGFNLSDATAVPFTP